MCVNNIYHCVCVVPGFGIMDVRDDACFGPPCSSIFQVSGPCRRPQPTTDARNQRQVMEPSRRLAMGWVCSRVRVPRVALIAVRAGQRMLQVEVKHNTIVFAHIVNSHRKPLLRAIILQKLDNEIPVVRTDRRQGCRKTSSHQQNVIHTAGLRFLAPDHLVDVSKEDAEEVILPPYWLSGRITLDQLAKSKQQACIFNVRRNGSRFASVVAICAKCVVGCITQIWANIDSLMTTTKF